MEIIAYKAHEGQYDCNGIPYIFHPFHVAEKMTDEITTCVALLHDVVEDTDVTIEDLEREFPREVTFDYVTRIKDNPVARKVKLGDLAHNSDETRLIGNDAVSIEQIEKWRRKYTRAKEILED